MKLSAAIDEYWLDKKLDFSLNTIRNYGYVFRYLVEYLGDAEIELVTSNDIRRFLEHLRTSRKMSRRSVHDAYIPLSSLWTWSAKEYGIPHIIREKITEPDYTERKISPFIQEEIRQLIKAAEQTEARSDTGIRDKRQTATRDKAIILTLVDSGLRASELCALIISDYDEKRGRLHVRHGKGDKERFVIIGNRTQKAILRYLSTRKRTKRQDPLFATKDGNQIKRENLYRLIKRIGDRAGIENAHPHRLRHTFAVNFLRNGGNVALLQELLGHESLEMVMVYVELAEQDLDAGQEYSPVDNWRI